MLVLNVPQIPYCRGAVTAASPQQGSELATGPCFPWRGIGDSARLGAGPAGGRFVAAAGPGIGWWMSRTLAGCGREAADLRA